MLHRLRLHTRKEVPIEKLIQEDNLLKRNHLAALLLSAYSQRLVKLGLGA